MAASLKNFGVKAYSGSVKKKGTKLDWTGQMALNSDSVFKKPSKIKQKSIFFVNSMSDFFHANAKTEWQSKVLEEIKSLPRHQFRILTKRSENIKGIMKKLGIRKFPDNVWIGATVEDYRVLDRIEIIKRIPAKIHFLSVEPLIEDFGKADLNGIEWVITGGESGPGARVMKFPWLKNVLEQTMALNIPHFFKQYGKAQNNPLFWKKVKGEYVPRNNPFEYVKKNDPEGKGGSKIDGVYYKEMPSY